MFDSDEVKQVEEEYKRWKKTSGITDIREVLKSACYNKL